MRYRPRRRWRWRWQLVVLTVTVYPGSALRQGFAQEGGMPVLAGSRWQGRKRGSGCRRRRGCGCGRGCGCRCGCRCRWRHGRPDRQAPVIIVRLPLRRQRRRDLRGNFCPQHVKRTLWVRGRSSAQWHITPRYGFQQQAAVIGQRSAASSHHRTGHGDGRGAFLENRQFQSHHPFHTTKLKDSGAG